MMERKNAHFVEAGGHTQKVYHPAVAATGVSGEYPTLRATTAQADPGLTHTLAIADVTDLQNMSNNLSGNYYLTGNIDASATSGWNGGLGFAPVGSFTGTLDGCGYTITSLYINRPATDYIGLFSDLAPAISEVANLELENCDITGQNYVGALVGKIQGSSIQNCHSSGGVSGKSYVGGLIGYMDWWGVENIFDSHSDCTITGLVYISSGWIGGFIGGIAGGQTSNCYATGNITCPDNGRNIGGFIGASVDGHWHIDNCHATGDVTGNYAAGFLGTAGSAIDIDACYATGDIYGIGVDPYIAGFCCSYGGNAAIDNCYSWGNCYSATHDSVAAGFSADSGTLVVIDNCYSIGLCDLDNPATHLSNPSGFNFCSGDPNSVTDSFWDTDTSGDLTSDGGVGHITSWMQTQANYEDAGWDFDTIWYMGSALPGTAEYWTETEIGYDHLIGETVSILADGIVYPDQVVDGSGDIDDTVFADATEVHVGLAYESKLKPMKPVSQPDMMSKTVTCKEMGISVHNTDDIKYGVHDDDMKEINFDDVSWKNKCEIDGLFTGSVAVSVPDGFSVNCPLQIITSSPLPCVIRALIPKVD